MSILHLPPTASNIPAWIRDAAGRVNQLIRNKQDRSDNLTSLSELDLTGHSGDVVAVVAGEDGFELVAGGGGGGVSDGDKGDIVVSSSGTVWSLDSGVVTAFARTVLDDADAAAVRTTIGAAATSHAHAQSDITLANDLAALEALSGTNTIYYRSAADTWTAVTIGTGLDFTGGSLTSTAGSKVEVVGSTTTISGGLITLSGLSLANYAKIEIILEDLTAGASLRPWLQVSVGGSFLASTNYQYYHRTGAGSGSTETEASTGTDAIFMLDATSANFQTATGNAAQAMATIVNPGGTSHHKQGRFEAMNGAGASGVFVWTEGGFKVANTGAIDGIRAGGGTPGSVVSLTNARLTILGHLRA